MFLGGSTTNSNSSAASTEYAQEEQNISMLSVQADTLKACNVTIGPTSAESNFTELLTNLANTIDANDQQITNLQSKGSENNQTLKQLNANVNCSTQKCSAGNDNLTSMNTVNNTECILDLNNQLISINELIQRMITDLELLENSLTQQNISLFTDLAAIRENVLQSNQTITLLAANVSNLIFFNFDNQSIIDLKQKVQLLNTSLMDTSSHLQTSIQGLEATVQVLNQTLPDQESISNQIDTLNQTVATLQESIGQWNLSLSDHFSSQIVILNSFKEIQNSHNVSIENLQSLVTNTTTKIQADIMEINSSIEVLNGQLISQMNNYTVLESDLNALVRFIGVSQLM